MPHSGSDSTYPTVQFSGTTSDRAKRLGRGPWLVIQVWQAALAVLGVTGLIVVLLVAFIGALRSLDLPWLIIFGVSVFLIVLLVVHAAWPAVARATGWRKFAASGARPTEGQDVLVRFAHDLIYQDRQNLNKYLTTTYIKSDYREIGSASPFVDFRFTVSSAASVELTINEGISGQLYFQGAPLGGRCELEIGSGGEVVVERGGTGIFVVRFWPESFLETIKGYRGRDDLVLDFSHLGVTLTGTYPTGETIERNVVFLRDYQTDVPERKVFWGPMDSDA